MGSVAVLRVERAWDGGPAAPDEAVRIEIERRAGGLIFRVDAPFHDDPPPGVPPGSAEGLWEHEAVEVFLLGRGGEYVEVEMGPHGHHLVLRFRGPRSAFARGLPLDFEARIADGRWKGEARLSADLVPAGLSRANAYAVHGEGSRRRHLAAFPVPGERPDFHRTEAFGPLDLDPAREGASP